MKKSFCLILAAVLMISLASCSGNPRNETTANTTDIEAQTTPVKNNGDETTTQNEPVVAGELFESVEIDMYGKINENSQYVAAVTHNGNIPNSDIGKTFITIYDIGQALKNTSMLSDQWVRIAKMSNNFLYNMAVGSDIGIFPCLINNDSFDNGSVNYYYQDHIDDQGLIWVSKENNANNTIIAKDYQESFFKVGTNWAWYSSEKESDVAYVKIGETENDNIFVQVNFTETYEINDSTDTVIAKLIEDKKFNQSVVLLNNSDDLSSVEQVIGEKHDLNTVSFLQDILAQKISNMYGLNLKSKDVQLHLDNKYLTYRTYDAEGKRVEVTFNYYPGATHYSNFEMTFEFCDGECPEDARYNYTDSDGNTYDYFWDNSNFYIFKAQELIGIAEVNYHQGTVIGGITELFGIKP